jgi:hypothetical protein
LGTENELCLDSAIKKMCCVDFPVPTQLILHRSLISENVRSIATKVAIQINCKVGGAPWTVDIPVQVSLYFRKIAMSHLFSCDYISHATVPSVVWWLSVLWSMFIVACVYWALVRIIVQDMNTCMDKC